MKRLLTIALLLITVGCAYAASTKLYELPLTNTLNDTDRLFIFQQMSGSRNLSGAGLKNVLKKETLGLENVTNESKTTMFSDAIFRDSNGIPLLSVSGGVDGPTINVPRGGFFTISNELPTSNGLVLITKNGSAGMQSTAGNIYISGETSAEVYSNQGPTRVVSGVGYVELYSPTSVRAQTPEFRVSNNLVMQTLSSYISNAAAVSAGLSVGTVYRNGDALMIVH